MRKLTEDFLSEEILNQLDFSSYTFFGGKKEQIEKILNETYQYHPKCFSKTNQGDLSFLQKVVDDKTYILKFIN